ncbi:MAG: hypothetical protein F6J93_07355 [Oscillatoria sp. SIO1A7]|nr:hypothetical protein [Oscillatoria sp. SIO1A7]
MGRIPTAIHPFEKKKAMEALTQSSQPAEERPSMSRKHDNFILAFSSGLAVRIKRSLQKIIKIVN